MSKLLFANINRLGVKLTLCALLSICVSLAVFFVLQAFSNRILDRASQTPGFEERQNRLVADEVQRYVNENGLTLSQAHMLWNIPGVDTSSLIMLYENGELVSDDDTMRYTLTKDESMRLYPINFADGTAQIYIWDYGYYLSYYRVADIICGAFAFLIFVVLFVQLIKKKLRYILMLEQELSILEGGDLEYPITIQDNDELTSLARGIDDMRRSFIERQAGETEALRANQSLVTSMSHDLRTPLTSLLGYIELIQNGQYTSEEQLKHFISASRDKVYRIKEMSDELFEYALCNGSENAIRLRSMDAYELFSQLLIEHSFELESAGFEPQLHISEFAAQVQADTGEIARVFENLCSNIKKYANPKRAVVLELRLKNGSICVRVENGVKEAESAESSHIGIKTCERILRRHGGDLWAENEGDTFIVTIELPVSENGHSGTKKNYLKKSS